MDTGQAEQYRKHDQVGQMCADGQDRARHNGGYCEGWTDVGGGTSINGQTEHGDNQDQAGHGGTVDDQDQTGQVGSGECHGRDGYTGMYGSQDQVGQIRSTHGHDQAGQVGRILYGE